MNAITYTSRANWGSSSRLGIFINDPNGIFKGEIESRQGEESQIAKNQLIL